MKTLNDIKQDMSVLYDQVKNGVVEVKTASELANIAGKYLKAEQLQLAREMFLKDHGRKPDQPLLTNQSQPVEQLGWSADEIAKVGNDGGTREAAAH